MSYFKPNLGMQGNIEEALKRNQQTNNKVLNETSAREQADLENREIIEQIRTDVYLNDIETQQSITEIQLQMLGG